MGSKLKLVLPLMLSLTVANANAVGFKTVILAADEIVQMIQLGKGSASKLLKGTFFTRRSSPTVHAALGSFQRADQEFLVLASKELRESTPGFKYVTIDVVTPMEQKVVDSIPTSGSAFFHNSIGELATETLIQSGTREQGMRIYEALKSSGLVTHNGEWIHEILEKYMAAKGAGLNPDIPPVFLNETAEEMVGNTVRSLDHRAFSQLGELGPASSFRFTIMFSDKATGEQMRRVLDLIAQNSK